MASTYTSLGIEKPADGEQSGTWGQTVNTNSEIIEQAIGGYASVDASAGGTVSVSISDGALSDGRNQTIKLTGAPAGSFTFQLPEVEKTFVIWNTSGQTATIQTVSATTSVSLADGSMVAVFSDGAGTVEAYTPFIAPDGSMDSVDIDGGTIDGVTLGGTSAGDATVLDLTATGTVDFSGISNAATVRTDLGLGTAAVEDVAASGTGDLLRIDGDGSSLTNLPASADQTARDGVTINAWEIARIDGLSNQALINTYLDVFTDETGVDNTTSTNETYDATGDYYTAGVTNYDGGHTATGSGGNGTLVDRSFSVPNDAVISKLAVYNVASGAIGSEVKLKILNEDSTTQYDVVVDEALTLDDSWWQEVTLSTPYTIPSTGTYRLGIYIPVNITVTGSTARSFTGSVDVTGDNQSGFTADTGNMQILRAIEENDMTLVSETITAAATPTEIRALIDVEEIGSATAGTDFTIEVSRDGTTWTAGTLGTISGDNTARAVYAATIDVSGQPSGTDVKWRFKTLNSKEIRLHRVALQADQALTV